MEAATAYAPGSASNLGPGFDCLGVAFTGMGDTVTARRSPVPGIRVSVSDSRIPTDPERNTAAIAGAVVARLGAWEGGLELSITKGLPLSGGLGGSAASAVAGAVAVDAVLGTHLGPLELFEAALEAEAVVAGRHPDNVAPSLLGGLILVSSMAPPRLSRIRVPSDLALVLATPAYHVETARARSVLKDVVPRGVAVAQAAHLAAFLLGIDRDDPDLIRASMVDLIAEPAREPLYPGAPSARAAGLEAGAIGVVVSGAGPSLVALAPLAKAEAVARALEEGYRRVGVEASGHVAQVDTLGARILT